MVTPLSIIVEDTTLTNEIIKVKCYFDDGTKVMMSPLCLYAANVYTIVAPVD